MNHLLVILTIWLTILALFVAGWWRWYGRQRASHRAAMRRLLEHSTNPEMLTGMEDLIEVWPYGVQHDPTPPRGAANTVFTDLQTVSERSVLRQEDGKPLMKMPSVDELAAKLANNRRFLEDMGLTEEPTEECKVCSNMRKLRCSVCKRSVATMSLTIIPFNAVCSACTEWFNYHEQDVSAAVARVGVDLRRGRYNRS